MTLTDAFIAHKQDLEARAIQGDEIAEKSLACITLLECGWREGDPDPDDGGDGPGGGEVIYLPLRKKAA